MNTDKSPPVVEGAEGLKPCPSCGKHEAMLAHNADYNFVLCPCGWRTGGFTDPAHAIEQWNTRPLPATGDAEDQESGNENQNSRHSAVVISKDNSLSAWQPIETAPKDGRRIFCCWPFWNNGEWPVLTEWRNDNWRADEIRDYTGARQPTHWMPLPSPPTAQVSASAPALYQTTPADGSASPPDSESLGDVDVVVARECAEKICEQFSDVLDANETDGYITTSEIISRIVSPYLRGQGVWDEAIAIAKGEHLLDLDICCDEAYDRAVTDVVTALEAARAAEQEKR